MSAKGKKKIKVREIESKVKEVKETKKESLLEEEVESSKNEWREDFVSSGSELTAGVLRSSESSQETGERPITPTQSREEPAFSQTQAYSVRQNNITEEERASRYVTPEQAARRVNPSLAQTNINFNPQSRNEDFANPELQRLRGESQDRKYEEIFEQKENKPRRRYPWEA